jgi:DNA invertase Pin-like site-specific DNA recombinase
MKSATYVRVSTENQSLERQLSATHEYARDLGADPSEIVTYRDKSTGTDTARNGYRELMADVEAGQYDAVVVHSVSRISRSIRDLDQIVERIVEDNQTAIHFISEGFDIRPDEEDPFQRAMLRLLGVFAELEADLAQKRTREGIRTRMNSDHYHHGPPPLGFEKNDGQLIEADGFDRVRSVLQLVDEGEMSKRKAARELDTSRRTINRSLERRELYNLAANVKSN